MRHLSQSPGPITGDSSEEHGVSNVPAGIGRKLMARALPAMVLAAALATPAAAQASLTAQGGKLTGGGLWQLGQSVALAGDGTVALAGAPANGSVRVLTRSGAAWADTGAPLVPAAGPDAAGFAAAVALSADAGVALVGAPDADAGYGAAWLFVRSGGTWTQAARLTGAGEASAGKFGSSVALSADGSVAVIGAPAEAGTAGAAWVFVRSGGTWTQRGTKLTGAGATGAATFGTAVAVAGDGATVVIGGPADNAGAGALWVFARAGDGTYAQDGPKVSAGSGNLGAAVAADATGSTMLGGAPLDGAAAGAAYVFGRSGSGFVQQGPKLTAPGLGSPQLGSSVALSDDGNVALLGAPTDTTTEGAGWVFERSGVAWTRREQLLPAGGVSARFGTAVALAADGHAAIVGGPFHSTLKGAVWAFAEAPSVTAIVPALGPTAGGTAVTITGTALAGAAAVRFGGTLAPTVQVDGPTQLTAVAPAGTLGAAHVTVETSGGTSAATSADLFAYADPPAAPTAVTATAGDGEATVTFAAPTSDGGRPVEGYTITVTPGGRTIDAAASPVTVTGLANGTPVTFTVRARNAVGPGPASAPSPAVTPRAPTPVVAAIALHQGPTVGGTVVEITGTHLAGATVVRFGAVPAAFVTDGDAQLAATAPAHASGQVDVTVTTAGGTSTTSCATAFTYRPDAGETLPAHRCAVAYPLRSTGAGRTPQAVGLSVPNDGHATLLAADGQPAAEVLAADGRYALDAAGLVLTFAPARGFVGVGAGVRYRVQGDEATEATSTYMPEVTLPPPPHASALASSGGPGAVQHVTPPVPDGASLALLDATGAPAPALPVTGEGRYDVGDGTIAFRPAAGFTGRARGVGYRVTDEYGQTADGAYVPTVTGTPPPPPAPHVRLTTAPLLVATAEGELTLGCGLTAGTVADCRIALLADVAGHDVAIGTGAVRSGRADVLVTVRLTALGRDLSRQPGGVAVRAAASVAVTGRTGRLTGTADLHAVARSFPLRHAVRFPRGSAVLRVGERRYLTALAPALAGVRIVTCVGAARDVGGARRDRLARARARAVCALLRRRLGRGTAVTARGERAGERRGGAARVELVLRY